MRTRRSLALFFCSFPFVLLQLNLTSCLPQTGGSGGGTAAPAFNISPTVLISADVVRGIAPLTVRFSSAGSTDDGLIVERFWDFGDNQTSREVSPTHRYETTGNFTVTLTLTDDQGAQNSRSIVISVTEAPVAVIDVDRTSAPSAPAVINFDGSRSRDPDGTLISFQWDFGDGSREVLPVVAHTFSSPGTFRVRLTVTDNTGVTSTEDQVIEIGIPRPSISFRSPTASVRNLVVSNDSPLFASVVFSVDPTVPRFLTAGLDGDQDICDGQSVVYEVETGAELARLLGHGNRVNSVSFSPDGVDVLSGSDDRTARLFDSETGDQIRSYTGNATVVTSVALSPDGETFVQGTQDGEVVIRSVASGNVLRTFAGHAAAVNSVAFSADGDFVASASDDLTTIVWDAGNTSEVATLVGHAFAVTSVAFSPTDSNRVVTGSVDQTARIWNSTTGDELEVLDAHTNSVAAVAVSNDGTRILTGSDDRSAILWDFSGREIRRFQGHSDRLRSVAFSPDGELIATGSADNSVRLWNVDDGETVRTLRPCESPISSLAFSPQGDRLVAGVAARNDIRLETLPRNGNDVNLTLPTEFDLTDVATGQYFLWAEIDTDRTSPVRTYSSTIVNVIPPFTGVVDSFTPRAPFVDDEASILFPPTAGRQVVSLGPLSEGDRLDVSLVTVPGYGTTTEDDGYGFMILDSEEKVFAVYQTDRGLLAPDQKLVIGHNSPNYYIVMDSGDSVHVRITRGFGTNPRVQRILLNFNGREALRVAGQNPVDVAAFDAADFNDLLNPPPAPPFGEAETTLMKLEIAETVREKFDDWDVQVFTTDDDEPPAQPHITIFFGGFADEDFGAADYIDPRNSTLTGTARVATYSIAEAFPASSATELANLIGVVAVHHAGHLMGLRHVEAAPNDIMTKEDPDSAQEFQNSLLRADELFVPTQIGSQDAPQILDEVVGPD